MSTSQAKVAIDKLLKIYEPLKEAQTLLSSLDSAEQSLKEMNARVSAGAAELDKQKKELEAAKQELEAAKVERADLVKRAEERVREMEAAERDKAHDILMQMEAAKVGLQRDLDAARSQLVLLEQEVAAKQEEFTRVTALVSEQRSKLEQALTAI